jgi:hypothetical protein
LPDWWSFLPPTQITREVAIKMIEYLKKCDSGDIPEGQRFQWYSTNLAEQPGQYLVQVPDIYILTIPSSRNNCSSEYSIYPLLATGWPSVISARDTGYISSRPSSP